MSTLTTTASKSSSGKSSNKENKKSQLNRKNASDTSDNQHSSDVKLQPTPEQLRIANLMNDKTDFNELQSKVDKIIELTGASKDEAAVALHDCEYELDKAIDMILEGESLNEAEWRSTGKKRKPKTAIITPQSQPSQEPEEKPNLNGEKKAVSNRGRGGPRLQRGGNIGKSWKPKEEKNDISSNDNTENIAPDDLRLNNAPPKRGDNRRGRGRGSNRGSYRGGERGGRGTRTFQNKGYRSNDGFPNSIDTWTNSTAEQVNSNSNTGGDCTTMTVGNWSDFAGNEDWSEEDWDSSLMETKVFTPSTKALSEKDEINEITSNTVNESSQGINLSSLLEKQANETNQQSSSSILGTNVSRSSNTASAGAALLQQLQQVASSQSSQINKFTLDQYTKQATENIKSLVGISTTTYYQNNSNLVATPNLDNQVSNLSHNRQLQSSNENQSGSLSSSKPPRLSVKRSTKIPESAVEMPSNDSISSLNVQFGALPFELGPEASNAFHEAVNHITSKTNKGITSGQSSSGSNTLSSAALLNAAVSDNAYRGSSSTTSRETPSKNQSASSSDLVLQNTVLGHQTIPSDVNLDRNKETCSSSYGSKVLDNSQNKSKLYPTSAQVQPQTTASNDMSSYKSTSYPQPDSSNTYGSNANYGTVSTAAPYVYPSTNQSASGVYSSGTSYSTFQPTTTTHSGVSTQKIGMKELDSTGSSQHKHSYDLPSVSNVAAGSLGLVSNSTVTTNVLKNSLTATGKGIPNVPPGVTPLLGTQYIMGQAGLPAFYPLYDVSIPAAHGRDHSFAYSANTDLKYSRADNDGSNVVSTQSPVSQTHNQTIFGQLPPGYCSGFFYTPSVNMMHQSLYGAATPIFPVTPPTNTHGGSTGSGFPKGTTGYGSHSYASAGYDALAAVPQPSDYVKTNYGPSTGQQPVKGINVGNTNDLSASNAMYGKSHPQLSKNYDKQGFQTATPPPFNMAGAAQPGTLGSAYAPTPSQYIQMLPQTQPSMLHHTLQGDASQSGATGVGGQRSISQAQKGSASNSKYYNNWN